jgi:hypothetical protein
MIKSEKKLREFESKINSKDEAVISEAIKLLRNETSFSGAIHLITVLFNRSDNDKLKNIVQNFLIDLKEPEVRKEVIAELNSSCSQKTKCMLVSSCWQSGLDYSEFSSDFANIFIEGDYKTALECFTVLEESSGRIPEIQRMEIIERLTNNEDLFTNEKRELNKALIGVLR